MKPSNPQIVPCRSILKSVPVIEFDRVFILQGDGDVNSSVTIGSETREDGGHESSAKGEVLDSGQQSNA